MARKIKKRKGTGDVQSDSGYLLPSQGFKKNAAAYENRGKSIQKRDQKGLDYGNYRYGKRARRA